MTLIRTMFQVTFLMLFAFSQTLYAQESDASSGQENEVYGKSERQRQLENVRLLIQHGQENEISRIGNNKSERQRQLEDVRFLIQEQQSRMEVVQKQREQEERIEGERGAYAKESGLSYSEMILFRTVMRAEIYEFDLDKIRQFVREEGNIDAKDSVTGAAAVHLAAFTRNLRALEVLKELGADMKATDNEGRTALHWLSTVSLDNSLLPSWLREAYKAYTVELERIHGINDSSLPHQVVAHEHNQRRFDKVGQFLLDSGVDSTVRDNSGRIAASSSLLIHILSGEGSNSKKNEKFSL